MKPLPPLDALVAFEAVLRHHGVTAAATELGLTQSAVSHRLSKLEAFIGTPLLRRGGGGVAPTRAGSELAALLPELLEQLGELRQRCRSRARETVLRVGAGTALTQGWLLPRLPAFARPQPQLQVELVSLEGDATARDADLDVQIGWVAASQLRLAPTRRVLCRESVFPVCSPGLIPPGAQPGDPALLRRLPLVHKVSRRDGAGAEWSWPTWFERLALGRVPAGGFTVDAIWAALAAAERGQGVALGRSLLVADALATRRLVRLLGPAQAMPSSKVQLVSWTAGGAGAAEPFVDWLLDEAQASLSALA